MNHPKRTVTSLLFGTALILLASLSSAVASDSHAGYYYPEPKTTEVYVSPLKTLRSVSRRSRIALMIGLSKQQYSRNYAPQYHIFAKGRSAQKMIVVSSGPGRYDTLYRLRGLLAALTSQARTSPLFNEAPSPENLNFFDLARLAGFEQITVSDGDRFAHRITIRGAN